MKQISLYLLLINMLLFQGVTAAELKVHGLFGDNMVLQRNQPIKIWGQAESDAIISVKFASLKSDIKADESGFWKTEFPAQSQGGPYTLYIESKEKTLYFHNLLIGDVWVASGQSNMEWKVSWKIDNYQQEIIDSDFPNIRFYKTNTKVLVSPSDDIEGTGWRIASPDTVGDFSAVAWFFAKHANRNTQIPIGIIESNVGGTPAEAWSPIEALLKHNGYKNIAKDFKDNPQDRNERIKQRGINEQLKWEIIKSNQGIKTLKIPSNDYDYSKWPTVEVPFSQPIEDVVWLKRTFNIQSIPNTATISFGELNQIAHIFINGKQIVYKNWEDSIKPYIISPELLQVGTNVITLRVVNSWDNQVIVGKKDETWLKLNEAKQDLSGNWYYSNNIEPSIPTVERISWWPSVLYNAMIHPLTQYPIKGALWYQGESNTDRPDDYTILFQDMISSWRKKWNIGNFPFVFAQLSSWKDIQEVPYESEWANLRYAQAKALELPNTGMAVTLDIGDAKDIHPRNKQDVGKRLWLAAKNIAYPDNIFHRGPTVTGITVTNNQVKVAFNQEHSLELRGDKLIGFEIAGKDKIFINASAKISGKNEVTIFNSKVSNPKYLRYAWQDNTPANLYNNLDLPAEPFKYTIEDQ
ncbi:sialate O-acetylesterase [Thalassotalea agariperforans]